MRATIARRRFGFAGGRSGPTWLVLTLVAAVLVRGVLPADPAAAQDAPSLLKSALDEGRDLYRDGEYDLAADALERARREDPDDEEAALLLGLAEIRRSRADVAATQFREYLSLSSDSGKKEEIRRLLPIVEREADLRAARMALSAEAIGGAPVVDDRLIAVLPFRSEGGGDTPVLSFGLATLLADNLAAVPNVQIVPPERVQRFMAEAKVSAQGLAGPTAAARIGRLLGAGRVVAGSYSIVSGPERIRTDVAVIAAKGGNKLSTVRMERLTADGAAVVGPLAEGVAAALGAPVASLDATALERLRREHTKSDEAFGAYGRGLERLDAGDAMEARLELERALAADGNFAAARRDLDRVPAAFVSLVAVGNMIESEDDDVGPAGEGGWSRGTLYLLGAGALAAGVAGVAIAVGGGGGGGGDNPDPQAPTLEGVSDRAVQVGDLVSFIVVGRDPDGTTVTLSADLAEAPGATFNQTPGNPATGEFRWIPDEGDLGVQSITFVAADEQDPPQTASATSRITVSALALTPTVTVGALTPTPTESPTPSPTATLGP